MRGKEGLSNKTSPIVAINFETMFRKPETLSDRLFGNSLSKRFDKRYRSLTKKLYDAGYNVYVTSFNPIKDLEDELWGHFIFFNNLIEYDNYAQLSYDTTFLYTYYIDEVNPKLLLRNVYSYDEFLEVTR